MINDTLAIRTTCSAEVAKSFGLKQWQRISWKTLAHETE
jgi:hypothetical protein